MHKYNAKGLECWGISQDALSAFLFLCTYSYLINARYWLGFFPRVSLSALAGWWTCYRLHHHQYYYHHYHYAFIIINIHISVSKAVITVLAPVPAKPRDCCLKGSKNEPTHPTEREGTTALQRYPLKFASSRPRHILSIPLSLHQDAMVW